MAEAVMDGRARQVLRGKRLEYFTIAWNTLEGILAILAGAVAGSISLMGEKAAPPPWAGWLGCACWQADSG